VDILLADELKVWRGKLYQKEAAAKLDIPLPTYRKYEKGKRTPNKLALAELKRRMSQHGN
jgi:DNA-binding XRE family transcriptional regulator